MTDTSQYKERLEKELQELTEELSGLGIHNPKVEADWIATPEDPVKAEADENVAADQKEEWMQEHGVTEELQTRYNNVKHALTKIEDGSYGVCEVSGETIEEERLNANPAARTCIKHIEDEKNLPQ